MDEDGDGDEQTWRPEGPTSEDLGEKEGIGEEEGKKLRSG